MKPKKGLKFRKYHNERNLNNIDYCEIRAIVDNEMIVIYWEVRGKCGYKMITIEEFEFYVEEGIYQEIK